MVLKLHGATIATCTKRVLTVIEELSIPYELVPVNFFAGEHKDPSFLAVQPFGQIPYIDDDGFKLFESRAICRYLALKYGGVEAGLVPAAGELEKVALFEQAASIETSNFDASASKLAYENLFKPMLGQTTNTEAVKALIPVLEGKIAGYEVMLGKTKYLAGDVVTIADLFHLSYGSLLAQQKIDFLESEKYPNVARWWKDISSRPSWKKVSSA
ncbi:glutathione S-transferase C-terminal-like protein [Epithele typhae]|uniref:glutathione S-transferase C-terminal-like protein n=1 Tax=Epithele typhae TaxID=378194 RepID=UPI0020071E15|nr:glutathione S-transferase C-terminal-like protein [Epithele typhae]KAH9934001.1 glutathione S-transferase C-terminal-like protein [Epithele typhae]